MNSLNIFNNAFAHKHTKNGFHRPNYSKLEILGLEQRINPSSISGAIYNIATVTGEAASTGSTATITNAGYNSTQSSSYWDTIVGGPNGTAGTWYIPPVQMTAFIVAEDTHIHTLVRLQNYYEFTCIDGHFQGPTFTQAEKFTPAGFVPLPMPSGSMMSGEISPDGVIYMVIYTPAQGGASAFTSPAKGHMIFAGGEWRMAMQTTIVVSTAPPFNMLQWANMTKLQSGQQLPTLDQAIEDTASLRSRDYAWLQGTEWSVQDSALYNGATESFRINEFIAGYFFGQSTGPDPFWIDGSVAEDGSIYLEFSAPAGGIAGGIFVTQLGSLNRSQTDNVWTMTFESYPPSANGPEYSGSATLIDSHLAPDVSYCDIFFTDDSATVIPFPGFTGAIHVASGDFNNDGVADIFAAAGPGGGPAIAIINSQTGEVLESFFAFAPSFTGGVFIAVQDFNGDGILDIIAGAGPGGGPEVRIFDGSTLKVLKSFFAYAQDFTGGVSVASLDFNNDGIFDIATGAGPGGAPHVKVFDGASNAIISQWYAYPLSFTGGVFVAAGDIGNNGTIEVITGAGSGGTPVVAVWDPYTGVLLSQFYAYAEDFTGGVCVAVNHGISDGLEDILTGAGSGGGPQVNAFSFPDLDLLFSFYSGASTNTGGVSVG